MPDPRAHSSASFIRSGRTSRAAVARSVLPSCIVALTAAAEPSIGQFELKTLECAPGLLEFQSQNAFSWGQPERQFEDTGTGIVFDENSVARQRHALELEFGFNESVKMRVGIELEKERIEEPATIEEANDFESLELTEYGAELIAVVVPRAGDGAGLGFVAEFEGPVEGEDSNALVLGPVIEFESGHWFAAAVPMVVHAFGGDAEDGEEIDDKWDFAYAAQLIYAYSPRWSLALEAYGTVERIAGSGNPSESAQMFGDFDQHRLGPVLYYTYTFGRPAPAASPSMLSSDADTDTRNTSLNIGLGLLAGLNANTPDATLKLSIEVDF